MLNNLWRDPTIRDILIVVGIVIVLWIKRQMKDFLYFFFRNPIVRGIIIVVGVPAFVWGLMHSLMVIPQLPYWLTVCQNASSLTGAVLSIWQPVLLPPGAVIAGGLSAYLAWKNRLVIPRIEI